MKRLLSVLSVAGALACGSVDEKQACSASTDCPVGQYCARAEGESRCWPDAVPPVASGVTATCSPPPCFRDGVLHVEATVTDANEVLDAAVTVDLDETRSFPMTRAGPVWAADVPLRELPFERFSSFVVATVTARDGARNASAPAAGGAVNVTRLKWERAIDSLAVLSPTSPAVMSDGSVVIAGSNGKVYFVAPDGTDAHPSLTVGTGAITAAPAIGQHAIWVGSEDFNLYALELDGSAVKASVGVNVAGPVKGSVALLPAGAKEWCFATATAGDGTGFVGVSSSAQNENDLAPGPAQEGFSTGPVIGADDRVHAPTATAINDATLRTYELNTTAVALVPSWTAAIGKKSAAPLAIDGLGGVLSASDEAPPVLNRTVPGPSATAAKIGDLSGLAADSMVVLSSGDIVVGDQGGRIHRFGATGPVWSPAPNLGSAVLAPLALMGTTAPLIVPTNAGRVFALADDGQTRWEGTLPSATQLRAGNIHTPAGQPAGPTMSIAYFASGNGRLYAVVVDGQLDASAPWPKAFHDPRNTNRAGPQP